jgi:DNA-binding NtrC family response regulator
MTIGVDVRVVATSNRDLPRAVSRGDFRQDLFFRLNVLPVHVPPLRDRVEDVPALVEHFVALTSRREGRAPTSFSSEAIGLLQSYSWPGNVRELQNIVERAVVLCRGQCVERDMLEPWLLTGGDAAAVGMQAAGAMSNGHGHSNGNLMTVSVMERKPLGADVVPHANGTVATAVAGEAVQIGGRVLEDIERDAIVRTLTKFNGHRQRTAQALGIGVRTLGLKLKKWKQLQLVDAAL